jgi:hypothetical protein
MVEIQTYISDPTIGLGQEKNGKLTSLLAYKDEMSHN